MKSKYIGVAVMLCVLFTGCGQKNPQAESDTEKNVPIMESQISPIVDREGADPFVTVYGDRYLYTKTTGDNISIGIADSIQTLGASRLQCVYDPGASLSDLWAPEIWQLDGTWYIYFAAVVPGEEMHRMYVLSNSSENPLEGVWECKALEGMDDKFAIDGTIMELAGKRYFLWSGWEGYENVRQDIYLAEMLSPTEVMNEKILLSMPELDWEKIGTPLVNEGPEVIVRENTVNLVYSASGSWTDDYCLGVLTMDAGEDPKNSESWVKQEEPILSKELDVYGPGHNCFTTSLDGEEDLIIYHAARWMGAGWSRSVRFGYVDFDEYGVIQPVSVTSGEEVVKVPSGEASVRTYPVDSFQLTGDLKLHEDSEKKYISGMMSVQDVAETTIHVEEEQDVYITVFVRAGDLMEGVISGLEVSVNGEAQSGEIYAGENYQPLYFPVHLEKGENVLKSVLI